MKTGVLCRAVLTVLAAQEASAAYRSSCFGRCGFQSSSQGYPNYQQRFGQVRYQSRYQNANYPNHFASSQSQFGSSVGRFGPSQSHYATTQTHFNPGQNSFVSSQSQYSSGPNRFGSVSSQFTSGRFGQPFPRSSFQSRFASATPEQKYQAHLAAQRQLGQHRRHEQSLLQSRSGLVRPGTPSAVLAAEKRADPKSLALGNQALQQILYLQNLVGAGRRR